MMRDRNPNPARPRVALDLMGGDLGPRAILEGAREALLETDVDLILVGSPDALATAKEFSSRWSLVESSNIVTMSDDPQTTVRERRDSSMMVATKLGSTGRADAVITAGNTGAALVAAAALMRRIRGIPHPALAVSLPTVRGSSTTLLDAGASLDPPVDYLVQFARFGIAYLEARFDLTDPSIGLLSNGTESIKGDRFRREAERALSVLPTFVGQVEGYDLVSGNVDLIISDGFVGDIALKSLESGIMLALQVFHRTSPRNAAAVSQAVRDRMDFGGVVLGVRGLMLILHGAANSSAVSRSIKLATELYRQDVLKSLGIHLSSI